MVACHTESKAWRRKREKSWHHEVVNITK